MKKNHHSKSGFVTARNLFGVLLCIAGISFATFSVSANSSREKSIKSPRGPVLIGPKAQPSPAAPSPAGDTLSTAHRAITYTDSTGAPLNPTPIATGTPTCGPSNALCSVFNLTIDPSINSLSGYQISIQWQWAVSTVDYDWFVEDSTNTVIAKNQSTADPSTIILPTTIAPGTYKLIGTLSTGAPISYTGTITLQPASSGTAGICGPPANCTPPRYQNYSAGAGQADDAGEPSLGVDWNPNNPALRHDKVNTGGVAFFTSGPHEWRVNFDDCSSPAVNLWEDVSFLTDQQFVLSDPIGFVDHYTSQPLGIADTPPKTGGRVFGLDLIGGQGNSLGGYTDDDGATSNPGGNGGAGAGPDHETLGGGPYSGTPPATASYPAAAGTTKTAIYYCSQNIVAEAQCSRSDDGGVTFGPGVPIFNPTQCTGGIHGHVKVAPDGTVYVPNSSCGTTGTTGVAVSTNNGLTWTENNVIGSTSTQDPSVGIGQNNVGKPVGNLSGTNTVYLGYTDGDGHAKVVHSGDRGANWSTPVDVGAPFGVTHAVFPVVVAGDDTRAAFAFLGTGNGISTDANGCDPYGATLNCANIWHLYVSTTYDGGTNWITVDATPNDPVQTGVVCLQGTTCAAGRNLLDFNDFAIDREGRGLVGYADGCVNCANTFNAQSGASHGTVTRQSGGRRLFAHFDPVEPAVPATPQLVSANRNGIGADIVWLEPDNGGSPITGYKIYRGTTSGGESFLTSVSGNTTNKYFDPNPPTANPVYYYVTAVNAQGESAHCPEISLGGLVVSGNACTFPYLQVAGAGTDGTLQIPTNEQHIQYVTVGEPFLNCADNSLTFIMKVPTLDPANTGTPVLPPNTEYQIVFGITDTLGAHRTIYVDMDTNCPGTPQNPAFTYGRRDPSATGGSFDQGECTEQFPANTCSKITGSYSSDGTITIKLDVSSPLNFSADAAAATPADGLAFTWNGSAVGTQLSNVSGEITLFAGCAAGFLETASSSAGTNYTRVGNQSCSTFIPIAALTASPMSGPASLTVNFNGTTSHEPTGACASINSYTIDYGDNTGPTHDTATNSTGLFTHQYTSPGDYTVRLTVTDTNGKTSTNLAQVVVSVSGSVPPIAGVVSRKTHGGAGTFDIQMPVTGTKGIECRTGGTSGNYTLVIVLQNTITSVGSATATATTSSGTQSVTVLPSSGLGTDTHQYFANLTGVPNASHVTVTLHGVTDSAGNFGDLAVPADFLIGDTNADHFCDAIDVSQTKSQSGKAVTNSPPNFREDVNTDGFIDAIDASLVKSKSGTALP